MTKNLWIKAAFIIAVLVHDIGFEAIAHEKVFIPVQVDVEEDRAPGPV